MGEILNRYMSGLADWSTPRSGMFYWLKLHGIKDSRKLIFEHALESNVSIFSIMHSIARKLHRVFHAFHDRHFKCYE